MKILIAISLALPVFAMAQQEAPQQPSMFGSLLPFLLMFAVMYIFFILPKQKENKKTEQMRSGLKKGDKVLTISGIIGVVAHIEEHHISIKTGDTKIDFEKTAIVKLLEPASDPSH